MAQKLIYNEVWRMRATAEQKAKLQAATPAEMRGSATFWRDVAVSMAEQLIRLRAGEITTDELGAWMAKLATEYLENVSREAQEYLEATTKPDEDKAL